MATKAQLAQAQKDIAAQRARRSAAPAAPAPKARVKQHVETTQPEAVHADVEALMADLPSPKRVIVGVVLGLAASFAVGYGIGMIMSYALAGIAVLTGAAWVTFTLSALVWIIGIYATWKLGGYVGGKVFASVVLPEGLASRCWASVKQGVTGTRDAVSDAIGSTSAVQRAKDFSGAFTRSAAA